MQRLAPEKPQPAIEAWTILWLTAAVGLLGAGLEALAGYRAVGFLFLVTVMILGLVYSAGPVLFAAGLSALVWDYFFIPPRFTFTIDNSEDLMMLLAYAVAAGVIGALTLRLRRMQERSSTRDRISSFMVEFAKLLASAQGSRDATIKALELLERRFDLRAGLSPAPDGALLSPQHLTIGERERSLMAKAAKSGQAQGWDGLHPRHLALPMPGGAEATAVLLLRRELGAELGDADMELLFGLAGQLGQFLQREALRERSQEAARLRESELLHQALLDSISHELRTPLTSLLGSAAALEDPARGAEPGSQRALLDEIRSSGERLNRVIENLLDMARLNSGALALKKEWQDPSELARLTVQRLKGPLTAHALRLELPMELPLVHVDYRLMEHALSNLLVNAAVYAPPGTEILVSAGVEEGSLCWRVADRGPGIREEDLDRVFDKFYRVQGSPTGGTGLGLFIARSLMRAHGGTAQARRRAGGGAEFVLCLPLGPGPGLPEEAA